ncbi:MULTISPECIES: pyruvoyl-dependent arginine decarboxylase [Haloferax]|uniref:arginine decarboxylase n=2 Tax=Haloferax TaxID=2251 RepID=A0A6G1Z0Z6_9EURY|nr:MULTISPECIES: pyruvoyl-dependent arginine decarboxylase [Haloferax]KAB1187413.1 pyruvoyl-dependent arginine decarboxylase subunit alpha [Haloferax sp. CBA1149]MRW80061.1 pyruvoyl-dependent arginine decarboxylase subunit alpha [Haloferax marinisediminis]
MSTIRVVRGVGTAPTEMASYDAALAAANIHNYNLVAVSSVVPADATVETVDVAPDLGPAGNRLTVVQARETTSTPGEHIVAGLGWSTGPGAGLFYEASGTDDDDVRRAILAGLDAGRDLRDWEFDDEQVALTAAEHEGEGYTTVITVAAYGQSESIF